MCLVYYVKFIVGLMINLVGLELLKNFFLFSVFMLSVNVIIVVVRIIVEVVVRFIVVVY